MTAGANPCRRAGFVALATLLLLSAVASAEAEVEISKPFSISDQYHNGSTFMNVRLLGVVRLQAATMNGLTVHELSGLAWDADEGLLYALSDDGFVVHLRPFFVRDVLDRVALVAAYPLRTAEGVAIEGEDRDSEGLTARNTRNGIKGDATLLVSFEINPRILEYTTSGQYLATHTLPPALRAPKAYAEVNNELEGLTEVPDFGLITAPERPLAAGDPATIPLYSLAGQVWQYVPVDARYSSLVGLETMPQGDVLVLERRYASMFRPVIFSLRRMHLPANRAQTPTITDIARFDTSKGWAIDNFESVAWHEGNRYFMVSDDNDSMIQKTLLMYFEILAPGP